MKILSVVGARPNFMKVAPIVNAIRAYAGAIEHVLVHTGQHYDRAMSDAFFEDLGLPHPDVHLGAGSGSHAAQTADIIARFEVVLEDERPDVVIVVGDVNSTLACALVTAKASFDAGGRRPLIAHVEAGLRAFDRGMPEEVNRVLTDHVADLLFVTEESGRLNLLKEGIARERIHLVGNTMIDSLLASVTRADASGVLREQGLRAGTGAVASFALLTLHRPSNVDRRATFCEVLKGLGELVARMPVLFPVHPRTRSRIGEHGLDRYFTCDPDTRGAIRILEPLGYLDFLCLMKNAALVVTDSGGIQEETTCLGVPCLTVRASTERPITVDVGTNVLAGVDAEGIRLAVRTQIARPKAGRVPALWDGSSAARIVDVLVAQCSPALMAHSISEVP
jgi:UDP-N-acetylglucosamine 2-epimerase (non-hydrolysing)